MDTNPTLFTKLHKYDWAFGKTDFRLISYLSPASQQLLRKGGQGLSQKLTKHQEFFLIWVKSLIVVKYHLSTHISAKNPTLDHVSQLLYRLVIRFVLNSSSVGEGLSVSSRLELDCAKNFRKLTPKSRTPQL